MVMGTGSVPSIMCVLQDAILIYKVYIIICSIYICLNTCGLIWGLRCAGSLTCYMVIVVSLLVTMQL